MLLMTEMPVPPQEFPSPRRHPGPPLAGDYVCNCAKEIMLWIFGHACPKKIAGELERWRSKLYKDLQSHNVNELFTRTSQERLALAYFFDVLLLDNFKNAILTDGQKVAAESLCVGAFHL